MSTLNPIKVLDKMKQKLQYNFKLKENDGFKKKCHIKIQITQK